MNIMLCSLFACVTARRHVYHLRDDYNFNPYFEKLKDVKPTLDDGAFPPLTNVHKGAKLVEESKYPWIARVVHSQNSNNPHMCTASCIDSGIFITAATCVANLKIEHTTILYDGHWLYPKAMVLPSNLSRQGYDDIGFLVTHWNSHMANYTVAKLYDGANRTESNWFSKTYHHEGWNHYAVGFATTSINANNYITEKVYLLTELEIIVNYKLCRDLLPPKQSTIYDVPCYGSCLASKYYTSKAGAYTSDNDFCKKFHQVVGGAVIEQSSGRLIGVATWGVGLGKLPLPVGFSVPNSENFFKDYRCAIKIRNVNSGPKPGYYQALCKD